MPPTLEELGLLKLSAVDRLEIAQALLESIEPDAETEQLIKSIRAELERRYHESEADPDEGLSWEEVEAQLVAKYKRP